MRPEWTLAAPQPLPGQTWDRLVLEVVEIRFPGDAPPGVAIRCRRWRGSAPAGEAFSLEFSADEVGDLTPLLEALGRAVDPPLMRRGHIPPGAESRLAPVPAPSAAPDQPVLRLGGADR